MRFDRKAFLIFAIIFFIEIFIALYVHDSFVRPYLGDALVVALIYYFFKAFLKVKQNYLLISVLVFSFTVEFLQKIHFINLLGLEGNRFWVIVLGNSYHWLDLLCYLGGGLLVYVMDIYKWRRHL